MSFDYASVAAEAAAVLREFGATGTLTRNTPGAYDPATAKAAITTTTQTVTAVLFPYGDKFVDGTLILAGDRQAFIAVVGVNPPQAGDVLTWGGETFTVVKAKNLSPARVAVLFECQVRNG